MREHARAFVASVIGRLDAHRAERGRPGLVCCALDTELMGHWWYEGPAFLAALLEAAPEAGLELATLPAALDLVAPHERPLELSSWGAAEGPQHLGLATGGGAGLRRSRRRAAHRRGRRERRLRRRSGARRPRAARAAVQRLGLHRNPRARRRLPAGTRAGPPGGTRCRAGRAGGAGASQPGPELDLSLLVAP